MGRFLLRIGAGQAVGGDGLGCGGCPALRRSAGRRRTSERRRPATGRPRPPWAPVAARACPVSSEAWTDPGRTSQSRSNAGACPIVSAPASANSCPAAGGRRGGRRRTSTSTKPVMRKKREGLTRGRPGDGVPERDRHEIPRGRRDPLRRVGRAPGTRRGGTRRSPAPTDHRQEGHPHQGQARAAARARRLAPRGDP